MKIARDVVNVIRPQEHVHAILVLQAAMELGLRVPSEIVDMVLYLRVQVRVSAVIIDCIKDIDHHPIA